MKIKSSYDHILDKSYKLMTKSDLPNHQIYVKEYKGCGRIRIILKSLIEFGFGFGLLKKSVREDWLGALTGKKYLAIPNKKVDSIISNAIPSNKPNLVDDKHKKAPSSIHSDKQAPKIDQIQITKSNPREVKQYFYMPQGRSIDMPYIEPFVAQYFPKCHTLTDLKNLKKNDKVVYFDFSNARYGRFEALDEELLAIQERTKTPVILAFIINESNTVSLNNVETAFKESLTAQFIFVSHYFKTKWDHTGMGSNTQFLENPVVLSNQLKIHL